MTATVGHQSSRGSAQRSSVAVVPRLPARRVAAALTVVVVVYLALASVFTTRTPAWENDDEADHVLFVEHLIQDGTLPPISPAGGTESHQAPLYYALLAGWQVAAGVPAFTPDPTASTVPLGPDGIRREMVDHTYDADQRSAARALHTLRWFSVLCGLGTVVAAFATGWLLTHRTSVAAAVAATVAT